jgi:hypothetical protein
MAIRFRIACVSKDILVGLTKNGMALRTLMMMRMTTTKALMIVIFAYLLGAYTDAQAMDKEQQCIADAIYHEARGESFEGMLAVANVIVNRMKSPLFPNTACGVVYQRKQFSWTLLPDKLSTPVLNYGGPILYISQLAMESRLIDITRGATHYHADYVSPYWADSKVKVFSVGKHLFYKTKQKFRSDWYEQK